MKATRHNGRSGKHGTYDAKHNDRRFDVENSEHIDAERRKFNVYWDCYQGYSLPNAENERARFKKVTDHHAIIPTGTVAKLDLSVLPSGEKEILKLIAIRLAEAVSESCRYVETLIEAECSNHKFEAKGKQILESGWKQISLQKVASTDDSEKADCSISKKNIEGQMIPIIEVTCKEGKTKPKVHFTEDTLLSAMERAGADETPDEVERKGLGTPATRAGVIEKLVRIGFIERKGDKKTKYLIPTQKGTA